jgi:SAM-dependent methyltransferase
VARRSLVRPGLPESSQAAWRRTYASTPYRQLPWFSPRPAPPLQRAVRDGWFPRGARILDVGCGAGTNALFLARSGYRVSGIDLAPAAIAAARARATRLGLSVDFRTGDALRLPYSRGWFGGLFDYGCFHSLPLGLRRAYSRELARVLRPGGRYLVAWIGRESGQKFGPPHRPSLEEAAAAYEEEFLFLRTEFARARRGSFSTYVAWLERRKNRRPRPR